MTIEKTDWHKDPRTWELVQLLVECRDALPAITIVRARLYDVSLTLGDRIESAIEPWEVADGTPGAI